MITKGNLNTQGQMKITKHYPGYVDTVNSENPESGEFTTKTELLKVPFVQEWMEDDWEEDYHWEIELQKPDKRSDTYAYLLEVSNDLSSWWVVGTVTKSSPSDEVKIMKNWFPKWNISNMKPREEFKEVKVEF